jgi:hypothetical protein
MSEPNLNLREKANSCFDGSLASTELVSRKNVWRMFGIKFQAEKQN